jgi:hypothetical protein
VSYGIYLTDTQTCTFTDVRIVRPPRDWRYLWLRRRPGYGLKIEAENFAMRGCRFTLKEPSP